MSLTVAGAIIENATLQEFSTDKQVYSDANINFNSKIQNAGNVLVSPHGIIQITDMFGHQVAAITVNDNAAPVFPQVSVCIHLHGKRPALRSDVMRQSAASWYRRHREEDDLRHDLILDIAMEADRAIPRIGPRYRAPHVCGDPDVHPSKVTWNGYLRQRSRGYEFLRAEVPALRLTSHRSHARRFLVLRGIPFRPLLRLCIAVWAAHLHARRVSRTKRVLL